MRDPSVSTIVHEDVLDAPNGLPAKLVAEKMGKNYYTLLKETNPAHPTHKFGADDVVPACRATGSLRPVRAQAEALGCALVEIPAAAGEISLAMHHVARNAAAFGQWMQTVAEAYKDGRITRDEFEQAEQKARQLVGEVLALVDLMDRETA